MRSTGLEQQRSGITDHATLTRSESDAPAPELTRARLSIVHCPDTSMVATCIELSRGQPPIVIGRQLDHSRRITDPQLSRVHARVVWDPGGNGFRVGDAQSKNGTFLNGQRTDSALLADGDVVRAGDTLFVYDHGDPMEELRAAAPRAAKSSLAVLILGETGSGKELMARAIHEMSGCSAFVALNCGGMPRDLVAAELFGHVRGAFSGARNDRTGLFSSADHGTLFLDEIGDLPLETQPALLRALQERTIRRVGSDTELKTTARVLAATHADLQARCRQRLFRNDLYARLAQIVIEIPPLRNRRAELLDLARGFASRRLELTPDAAEALLAWHWPHNVRELKTLVESFEALSDETVMTLRALRRLGAELADGGSGPAQADTSVAGAPPTENDELRLRQLLRAHRGNVSSVARELGKSRSHVYRLMKTFGLSPGSGRRRL